MTNDERRAIEADCGRLIRLYANLADAGEWARVAGLYTDDGRFARPSRPGEFVTGREAILASFTARPARPQRHMVGNIVVDVVDGHHATAFSVMLLFTGEVPAEGGLAVRDATGPLVGSYTDRLVRTADGWRFAERVGGLDFRP
ncbi:nuclear transport factor 2 family protein [Croceibacterium mercuriale]|nr:nuclear transport factor 2 family protein [Croceibacterium mercuriale]